jgi:hypothetical protein
VSADDDAFLTRWSRRKREARREQAPAEPIQPVDDGEAAAPSSSAAPTEAELTPEEIAALPKIEELAPDSDISGFLRKGVPELLRNAALRRIWALDPAVRDYVGDARDYAYDWNVPGGVPGNGPLSPTLKPPKAVEDFFSKGQETTADDAAATAQTRKADEQAGGRHGPDDPKPPLASASVRLREPADGHSEFPAADPAAEPNVGSPVRVPPRRHGGAIPA